MKQSFDEYCMEKFGAILTEETAIKVWGEGDCIAIGKHSYDEDAQEYDRNYQGYTNEEVIQKLVRWGASSLIDNEYEKWLSSNPA